MSKFRYPETKEEYVAVFREMWEWISNECIEREEKVSKYEYFNYLSDMYGGEQIYVCADCWLCEYNAIVESLYDEACSHCPISWSPEGNLCYEYGELYDRWKKCPCDSYVEASEIAKAISELPMKEE